MSFPPELLAVAKQRAVNFGLPFSTYVQKCVEVDLAKREAMVFTEKKARATTPRSGARARSGV